MIKLYDAPVSGNCHKVRLLLSLLGLDYETVPVNLPEQEQKTPDFLKMNPLGHVPVLDDDGLILRDSQAICTYLAGKYGGEKWLPVSDPIAMGHVMEWLSFSANEIQHGCAVTRALVLFNREGDREATRAAAHRVLGVMDAHLADNDWLVGGSATVAEATCYPYIALVHQGGVDPHGYANVSAWMARVEALDGYVGMDAMPAPKA